MNIIVGLGNPGEKYKTTRHNAGFLLLDKLANNNDLTWKFNKKFNAEICKLNDTLLVKPQTLMNNSGQSVQAVMSYYNLIPKTLGVIKKKNCDLSSSLTIIHDDKDIELGKHKISENSRSAGHNGVQSIINHLKTKNFQRIRIGIRTETIKYIPINKFVLQRFNKDELSTLSKETDKILKNLNL